MYTLLKLTAKNFLSLKDISLDLSKSGLWLISGYNEVGGDSNGAGKSAVFSAISFALFGRTSKGMTSDVASWSGGEVEVHLFLKGKDDSLVEITRTSNKTVLDIDGKQITGNKLDVQKAINDLVHSDYFIWINSTLWAAGSTDFLAASADSDKKKLLKSIMGLDQIDKAYEKVKAEYDVATTVADKLTNTISASKETLADIERRKEEYDKRCGSWDEEKKAKVEDLQRQIRETDTTEDEGDRQLLQEVDADYQQAYKAYQDKVDRIPEVSDALAESLSKISKLTATKEGLTESLKVLATKDGSKCPYCGSIVSRKTLGPHKKEITDKIDVLSAELYKQNLIYETLETEQDNLLELERNYKALKEQSRELSYKISLKNKETEGTVARKRLLERMLKEKEFEENPYYKMLQELRDRATETMENFTISNQKLKDVVHRIDILAYLKWMLSREGVSSFIIERAFGRLENLANFYMSKLSTEGFLIEIKPQRELKSKALKEEIDIIVTQGKNRIPFWNLSDGQRQRLNVALLVAIYRLCRDYGMARFDFLLLDEVLDLSLGSKGQEDVLQFMKEMLAEIYNVFIISHKEGISSNFDHEIILRRSREGVSTVEVQG